MDGIKPKPSGAFARQIVYISLFLCTIGIYLRMKLFGLHMEGTNNNKAICKRKLTS